MSVSEERGEIPLSPGRESLAAGILLPATIFAIAANAIGGLLAPGWMGVAGETAVQGWKKWANLTSISAATLGMLAVAALVLAVVGNPRTSISTRLVASFGACLVFTFSAIAIGRGLEPAQQIVLFAGAFAVMVAGTVEGLGPAVSRALGVQLGLLALTAILRVSAWALAWAAARKGNPNAVLWAQVAASAALLAELLAQIFVVVYLIHRPGARGAIVTFVAIAIAIFAATWALGASIHATGGLRDALQRALSLRVQGGGPLPTWVAVEASTHEIALLERGVRISLLPLVFAELLSITLPIAAIASASRANVPLLSAIALGALSRGQVDAPLRALELAAAALAALALSRAAREGRRS